MTTYAIVGSCVVSSLLVVFLFEYQVYSLVDILDGEGRLRVAVLDGEEVPRGVIEGDGLLGVGAVDARLHQDRVAVVGPGVEVRLEVAGCIVPALTKVSIWRAS